MVQFRECLNSLRPYTPGRPIEYVQKEFNLESVIKLASNENPYGCSKKVIEAIKNFDSHSIYPDGSCLELRSKLSGMLGVGPNNLIFGSGTDELIYLLSKSIINSGDECITAEISFPQYAASVMAMDGKVTYSKMKNYAYDLNDILAKITARTKIIYISNPNNPTGTAFPKEQQLDFINKVPKNILTVFDEAYAEFMADGDMAPTETLQLTKAHENIVLLKTFSKAYGLASFRVGYAVANEYIISNLEKIRNPFNVSSIAQAAAIAALGDESFLRYTVENNQKVKKYLYDEFSSLGLPYIPSYANFIMVDIKKDSNEIFKKLMSEGLIVRPGAAYGMPTFLRVSFGALHEMEKFISVLKKYL
ncbi:MAG: histidinol-phosphate transaminase [Clostridiales bacterium]|jgi:histidinol-phosphate aminotransferase|nr:histidinol-phosphate transaminase [Clostridiales bacterium]